MRGFHVIAAFIIPLSIPGDALASTKGPSKAAPLDWSRLIRLAPQADPAVKRALAHVEIARRRVARAPHNPNNTVIEGAAGVRVDFSGKPGPDVAVGVAHTFELGDKPRRRTDVANAELEVAAAAVQRAERLAVARVAGIWARWIAAARRVEATKEVVALAERLVSRTGKLVKGGAGTLPQLKAAELLLARTRIALMESATETRTLEARLAVHLGAEGRLEAPTNAGLPAVPPLKVVLAEAPKRRAEVREVLSQIKLVKSQRLLAEANGVGDLTFGGEVGLEGQEVVGVLTLSVPLSTSRRPAATMRVHDSRIAALETQKLATIRTIKADLVRAWWQWSGFRKQADALKKLKTGVVADALQLAAKLIERGQGTALELLTVLQQASEVRLRYLEMEALAYNAAVLVLVTGGEL